MDLSQLSLDVNILWGDLLYLQNVRGAINEQLWDDELLEYSPLSLMQIQVLQNAHFFLQQKEIYVQSDRCFNYWANVIRS